MFSRIRKRLSYANVALTLALVFAMSGGAYAASRYVITSTKQIKPSVLKQLKGATGATGAPGATGAKGETGPAGLAGSPGKEGAPGTGKEGAPGKEGKEGPEGKEGSPWTAGGTLPPGKTEKGQWIASSQGKVAAGTDISTAAAFPIPLASPVASSHVIGVKEGEGEEDESSAIKNHECEGTVEEPQAAKGNFCVFISGEEHLKEVHGTEKVLIYNGEKKILALGAGLTGSIFIVEAAEEGEVLAVGSWAVTAE
jgi:hypothetical protein